MRAPVSSEQRSFSGTKYQKKVVIFIGLCFVFMANSKVDRLGILTFKFEHTYRKRSNGSS